MSGKYYTFPNLHPMPEQYKILGEAEGERVGDGVILSCHSREGGNTIILKLSLPFHLVLFYNYTQCLLDIKSYP